MPHGSLSSWAVLCVFALSVLQAHAVNNVTVSAAADVTFGSVLTNSSNGLSSVLCFGNNAGEELRAVLDFQSSDFQSFVESLGETDRIVSAVVQLHVVTQGDGAPSLAFLTTPFLEPNTGSSSSDCEQFANDVTTWDAPWASPGGDFAQPELASQTVVLPNGTVLLQWDVTTLVLKWFEDLTSSDDLGFIVLAPASSLWSVASTDSANSFLHPSLLVTVTPGVVAGTPGCLSLAPPDVCTTDIKQVATMPGDFCGWCQPEDGRTEWHFCSTADAECVPNDRGVGTCRTIIYRTIGETCGGENVVCQQGEYDVVCNPNGICGADKVFMPNEECDLDQNSVTPINSGCISKECLEITAGESPVCSFIAPRGNCRGRPADCVASTFCASNGTCEPRGGADATCTSQNQCQATFQCIEGRCARLGSGAAGDSCIDDFSCAAGLACGWDGECFTVETDVSCASTPCPRPEYQCVCNYKTGTQTCWYPLLTETKSLWEEAATCIADHADDGCALEQPFWKENCQGQNCKAEIAKAREAFDAETAGAYNNGLKSHGSGSVLAVAASLLAVVAVLAL